MKKNIIKNKYLRTVLALSTVLMMASCVQDNLDLDDLPDVGEIEDLTAPEAAFSFSRDSGNFLIFQLINESTSATEYEWVLPVGASLYLVDDPDASLTDKDIQVIFDDLGFYEVSLIATDDLGVSSELATEEIEVINVAGDPPLYNFDFDSLAGPNTGSTCSCTGWLNRSLGTQAESSSSGTTFDGRDSEAVKFGDIDADIIYQEFPVIPNTSYRVNYTYRIDGTDGELAESMLEVRVLSENGFTEGYVPDYTINQAVDTVENLRGFGYQSIDDVENDDFNIAHVVHEFQERSYKEGTFVFNSGENENLVLFARGFGGDGVTFDDSSRDFGWNNGAEEIRMDFLEVKVDN